jgi:hypothetical protein
MDHALTHDRGVEPAQAPFRRRCVSGLDGSVIDSRLNATAEDVKRPARNANFGELDNDFRADAPALAGTPRAPVEPARQNVFSERTGPRRESERGDFFDAFLRDEPSMPIRPTRACSIGRLGMPPFEMLI